MIIYGDAVEMAEPFTLTKSTKSFDVKFMAFDQCALGFSILILSFAFLVRLFALSMHGYCDDDCIQLLTTHIFIWI